MKVTSAVKRLLPIALIAALAVIASCAIASQDSNASLRSDEAAIAQIRSDAALEKALVEDIRGKILSRYAPAALSMDEAGRNDAFTALVTEPGFYEEHESELTALEADFETKRPRPAKRLFPDGIPWGIETDEDFIIGNDTFVSKRNAESAALIESILSSRPNADASSKAAICFGIVNWPSGKITYRLDSTVTSTNASAIRSAFATWQGLTGGKVTFKEIPNTSGWKLAWSLGVNYHVLVKVDNSLGGGLVNFPGYCARQSLTFSSSAAVQSVLLHEVGHVIGLMEGQQVYNRDDYITVAFENIIDSQEYLFWKLVSVQSNGYDRYSIMHYHSYACSSNGLPVFMDKSGNYIYDCGSSYPSAQDVSFVKSLY